MKCTWRWMGENVVDAAMKKAIIHLDNFYRSLNNKNTKRDLRGKKRFDLLNHACPTPQNNVHINFNFQDFFSSTLIENVDKTFQNVTVIHEFQGRELIDIYVLWIFLKRIHPLTAWVAFFSHHLPHRKSLLEWKSFLESSHGINGSFYVGDDEKSTRECH